MPLHSHPLSEYPITVRYLGPHDFGDNLRRKRRRTASLRPGYPDQRSAHDLASTLVACCSSRTLATSCDTAGAGPRRLPVGGRHCAASGSHIVSSPGARSRCESSSLGARRVSRTTGDAKKDGRQHRRHRSHQADHRELRRLALDSRIGFKDLITICSPIFVPSVIRVRLMVEATHGRLAVITCSSTSNCSP